MNILIESGATKSTCIGYSGTRTFFVYKTTGINATYATKDAIFAIFEEIIAKNNIVIDEVENIRYYGAGCFNIINVEKIKNVLSDLFPNANITVLSDLYAACHALCNDKSGFVGILGTGAASCFYDGKQIVNKAPSLGYLLGDEGSGTYLGKLFITEYLTDKIELKTAQDFEKTFAASKQIVFEKVYQTPNPQTFFASIPVFLQKHLENKQIKTLIENAFQDFFDKQMEYYSEAPFSWFFCGSIAYYFQDILVETAHKNNLKIEKIIQECAQDLLFAAH
jgi:N-acetylglucosamine kinase-like BadF-type ATPase